MAWCDSYPHGPLRKGPWKGENKGGEGRGRRIDGGPCTVATLVVIQLALKQGGKTRGETVQQGEQGGLER